MPMAECFFISDPAAWNALLRPLPCAHVLQTWEWGEFKRRTTGWTPERLAFRQGDQIVAAAQILTRRIGPLRVMYVPKGPALDYADAGLLATVLNYLQTLARRRGAIWLKIDPDVVVGTGIPNSSPLPEREEGEGKSRDDPTGQAVLRALRARGWRFSADQVQFRNTITVDLTRPADDLLASMNQSTRRKVRTAEKKGVTVRPAGVDDIPTLYDLYRVTGARDGFLIRPLDYYRDAWGTFMQAGLAQAFLAEAEGRPIAHVILLHFGHKCWYFYGASSYEARERMPNYALQWAAMQWAQAQGYPVYDFWGAPDTFEESDRLWGVYQFKRGFGGVITRHIGAWDYAPYPPLYWAYTTLMPRLLDLMRRRAD
jgi:lipid II:glycine glycyltransferase (peptidoglycan interpeptide bridge formation enzyme)